MGQQESQFSDEEEGEYNYNRGVGQCSIYVSRGHGIGLIFKVKDITNR